MTEPTPQNRYQVIGWQILHTIGAHVIWVFEGNVFNIGYVGLFMVSRPGQVGPLSLLFLQPFGSLTLVESIVVCINPHLTALYRFANQARMPRANKL